MILPLLVCAVSALRRYDQQNGISLQVETDRNRKLYQHNNHIFEFELLEAIETSTTQNFQFQRFPDFFVFSFSRDSEREIIAREIVNE